MSSRCSELGAGLSSMLSPFILLNSSKSPNTWCGADTFRPPSPPANDGGRPFSKISFVSSSEREFSRSGREI